jgi:hypothetical protein
LRGAKRRGFSSTFARALCVEDQGLDTLGVVMMQTPGISTNNTSGTEIGGFHPFYSRGYRLDNYQLDGALAPSSAFSGGWQGSYGWQGNSSLEPSPMTGKKTVSSPLTWASSKT